MLFREEYSLEEEERIKLLTHYFQRYRSAGRFPFDIDSHARIFARRISSHASQNQRLPAGKKNSSSHVLM